MTGTNDLFAFFVRKRLRAEQSRTKTLLFHTLDEDLSFNDVITVPSALKGWSKKTQVLFQAIIQTATPPSLMLSVIPFITSKARNPLWPEMFPSRCYW